MLEPPLSFFNFSSVCVCVCVLTTVRESGKYTVASSNPILGMEFLLAFFPVSVASDECTDNVCNCTWRGVHSEVVQGRVTLAGAPFGVHLTDTAKWTTNGLSVAQVESQFASKLGDMSAFDAFMDYSLGLCMVSETFDSTLANLTAAGHAYLPVAWESSSSEASGDWYSAFVHVPESQMILELITDSSALLSSSSSSSSLRRLETRLSPAQVARCQSSFDNGGLPLVSTVSRAASNVTEVQAFYGVQRRAAIENSVGFESVHVVDESRGFGTIEGVLEKATGHVRVV